MPKEQLSRIGHPTADIVRRITENKLEVSVSEGTVQAWITLSRSIRAADDLIDREASIEARQAIYDKGINYLAGDNDDLGIDDEILVREMTALKAHLGLLPIEQKESFIKDLRKLLRIGEMLRKAEDPANLARITMLEGQTTARLYSNFLPLEFFKLDGYRDYVKYFTRLGRAANAFDSIVDFSTDYKQGKTMVKPTPRNMALFAKSTLASVAFIVTHTRPGFLKTGVDAAIGVAKDRKGNSSMHFNPSR
ncbi:MAG: hypothetical protein UU21_C0001G0105 [Candidatus Levybacteria bacterium GW2011_GWA2_40_8]|nr:MAG: hypothetical protein UU21_C0001G0105 [Candidatus Levybacteria bacterium GW2011_GWA2_40_8]